MSYFMTISGAALEIPSITGAELILATNAQYYIKSMASELECLDGEPVYLVHDGETGTSDIIVADLENALLDGVRVNELPAAMVLQACFNKRISFRVWWANNDRKAHVNNTTSVSDLAEAYATIKAGRGATWSARVGRNREVGAVIGSDHVYTG